MKTKRREKKCRTEKEPHKAPFYGWFSHTQIFAAMESYNHIQALQLTQSYIALGGSPPLQSLTSIGTCGELLFASGNLAR